MRSDRGWYLRAGPEQVLWTHCSLFLVFHLEARRFPSRSLCSYRLPHFTLLMAHRLLGKQKAGMCYRPALSWGQRLSLPLSAQTPNPASSDIFSSNVPPTGLSWGSATLSHELSRRLGHRQSLQPWLEPPVTYLKVARSVLIA